MSEKDFGSGQEQSAPDGAKSAVRFGNRTLYCDIGVPFSRYAVILDVGRHFDIGWRYKREPSLRKERHDAGTSA